MNWLYCAFRATIDKLKKGKTCQLIIPENDSLKETLGLLEKKFDEKKAAGAQGKKANELGDQAGISNLMYSYRILSEKSQKSIHWNCCIGWSHWIID